MNSNAKAWVAALRSGKYRQGRGRLRNCGVRGARFCCLGVACDVSGLGRWDTYSGRYDIEVEGRRQRGNQFGIHPEVRKWLGLRDGLGSFSGSSSLAGMNDTAGATFDELADLIESEPEGLFEAP